jgi:signal transduction histidine kinase
VVWDGVVWDITQGKRAELALAGSQEQLRELSAHLESVREEEKARIAREVHDELGQMLTVLKLEVSMCELAFAELDPGLNERLASMKRLIAQLFQLVRDVATALRPPILDAGIASAIEWQARRFERARRSLSGAGAGQSASIERCQGHRPVPYPAGGADQRDAPCPGAHVEIELVHEAGSCA